MSDQEKDIKVRKAARRLVRAGLRVKGVNPNAVRDAVAEMRGQEIGDEEADALVSTLDAAVLAAELAVEFAPHFLAIAEAIIERAEGPWTRHLAELVDAAGEENRDV